MKTSNIIKALVRIQNGNFEPGERDELIEELAVQDVIPLCQHGSNQNIYEWLNKRQFDGTETAQSLADEWNIKMIDIDNLNKAAVENMANGMDVFSALQRAAWDAGLELFKSGEDCSVYTDGDGFVNVWHHSDEIDHGESGFDDQYEWAIQ